MEVGLAFDASSRTGEYLKVANSVRNGPDWTGRTGRTGGRPH